MNIVCIGAHPDDCEAYAGGTCVKWARLGHDVIFVSMTNGDAGHYAMSGEALAERRREESRVSAERGGVRSLVLDHHDGELMPTLEARKQIVRTLREARADIVITHLPSDYHPDHRYTSLLVQDASFMVTVPNFCPDAPRLERNPLFLYMMESRLAKAEFSPHIAVAVDDVMPVKWDMLDAMESQIYEWLPWLDGRLDEVPADSAARKDWLRATWAPMFLSRGRDARRLLEKWYGPKLTKQIRYAELFEVCPYGHQPSRRELKELLPFYPKSKS